MSRSQIRSAVVAFVVALAVCLVFLRVGSAILVGLAVAAFAVLVPRLGAVREPELRGVERVSRDGVRSDVQDLTWSLVGRDGHAGERAVRRLQQTGAVRLARHGIDLADARDADRAVALVGRRAYVALTGPTSRSLSIPDVRHTIQALEHLGSTPRTHPENS